MLTVRILPCLDTHDGRVVKGVQFQDLRDAGDPVELAERYEADGADELCLLDVSATTEGRGNALETVRGIRRVLSIPLTVGGGVRVADDALSLLDAGADKVAINTAAVRAPETIDAMASRFGSQCTVVAIDAARLVPANAADQRAAERNPRFEVVVASGRERTGRDVLSWGHEVGERGAGEILLTSWDRDGTREGYDVELIAAVSQTVPMPVIASGGAATAAHLYEAISAGADALLAASIFHDGEFTVADMKQELAQLGVEIRP